VPFRSFSAEAQMQSVASGVDLAAGRTVGEGLVNCGHEPGTVGQSSRVMSTRPSQPMALDARMMELFALVSEGLAGATGAFLEGDRAAARMLVERDALIDRTYRELEEHVLRQLTQPGVDPSEQHLMLCVLRIVPELERSGDLAEHIAQRAVTRLSGEITPRMRGLVEQMGRVGVEMWRAVADAYVDRDGSAAAHLTVRDEEVDDLHVSLVA
jgi:phosphate transport system protein